MTITRAPRPESNFYILDKRISEDSRLSWGARGLLIFLLGKPDSWNVSISHLRDETKDTAKPTGRDGVYGLLDELIQAGYVIRSQERIESGGFSNNAYVVRESPLPENPYTANPYTANPTLVSTDSKQVLNQSKKHLCDEEFEAAWKAYPKRDGSNPKTAAQKCWNARLKDGVSAQAMIEGICRYASYCRQKEMIGTSYVMQAARFFGTNKEFENAWAMPSAIGGAPTKEWETPTRDQILAKGPRRDGKVPHDKWDSGVHQFVFPVTEDMVGQQ